MCSLFIIFLASTTFGLSYFYFSNNQSVENTIGNNSLKIDDIKENYDFNKNTNTKEGKTYTIYFFPSASYLYLYSQYLNGNISIKPEDEFGYKEPTYNDDGTLKTDSTSGNVIYKLSDNTGKYQKTDGTSTSDGEITYDGAYRKYMAEAFNCNNFEADGGSAYASGSAYNQSQDALPSGKRRTWGIPNDSFTIFENDPDREEHFNGRNQYSTDRLGCWGDCYYYGQTISDSKDDNAPTGLIKGDGVNESVSGMDDTNTGRYIPIKLIVKNTLTSTTMEKVVQNIFTSMGTDLGSSYTYRYLHNYTFTQWTYVTDPDNEDDSKRGYPYSPEKNNDSYGENTVGEAFKPSPRDTYFDMFTDLDKYADSQGVIRLFPLFSNGKKSSATTYLDGGGSSERLTIKTSSDSSQTIEYKYPLFNTDVYNDGDGYFTYDLNGTNTQEVKLKSEYIRLFSFNNIKINSSTTSLEFAANNIWNQPTGWNIDEETNRLLWRNLYELSSSYIKSMISNYGEGLYTFYMIVANYSYQNGPYEHSTYSVDDMKGSYDCFYNNVVSQAIDGKFASLKGKHIIQVTEGSIDNDYRCSPTVIVFEKIDEPKLMTSDNEISDVSSFVSTNYNTGRSFFRNVNPLYKGIKDNNSFKIEGNDLSSDSPYTYLVKNVDLSNSDYFTISFSDSSLSNDIFTTSNDKMAYEYLISDPANTTDIDEDSIYKRPFGDDGYIESISTVDSNDKIQIVFKLKSDDYRDVYDLLIKYNSTYDKYDIYMRRHGKLFLYVFDQDLTSTTSDGFVNHSYDSNYKVGDASLLFDKNYTENSSLTSKDMSSDVNSGLTLDQCLRKKIGGDISYSNSSLLNYVLKDRVTDEIVARYVEETDSPNNTIYTLKCTLTMNKNHILYLYQQI